MANELGYYNALLGRLFDNGTPLTLRGGLNFIGFHVTQSQYGYDVSPVAGGGIAASDVTNNSSVTGATVKDALNAIGATGATGAVPYNAGTNGPLARTTWLTDGTTISALSSLSFTGGGGTGLVRVGAGTAGASIKVISGFKADGVTVATLMSWGLANNRLDIGDVAGGSVAAIRLGGNFMTWDFSSTGSTFTSDLHRLICSATTMLDVTATAGFDFKTKPLFAVDSLTMGATASAASTGGFRLPLLFDMMAGTANSRVFGIGGTNGDTTWGNPTAGTRYFDAGTSGAAPAAHVFRGAGFTFLAQIGTAASASSLSAPNGAIATGYLNGARIAPPTQASLVSGANAVNMTAAANYFMLAGTTATASTVTCGATGAATGACLSFYIQAQAHNVTIADASGTSLRVVSAGEKEIVDVRWDTSTSKYANPSFKKAQ